MNSAREKTILLVEDEALIAMAEKARLQAAGYSVVHVMSGEKALELFCQKNGTIDLVLMDIDLGKGIDGTEAAKEILKNHEIPLLFLSSHTEKELVDKTEQITNYGYVVKNSSFTVLDASIKMAFKLFEALQNVKMQKMDMEAAYEEMQVSNELLQKSRNDLITSQATIQNKLKAILEPEGRTADLELSDLIDTRELQSLLEDFYKLSGILGAILDIHGNVLVATGWQDICTKFHRCNPVTARHCQESDSLLTTGVAPGTFKTYRCKNNMRDMVTPLVIDGNHIGNIFIGQFFFDDEVPDMELFRQQARTYGFNEAEYLAALEKVPRFSREKADAGMRFYSKLAGVISKLSYSSIKLSRTIAERASADEKLQETKNYLENLISYANAPIIVWDRDYRITIFNTAFQDLSGIPESGALGKDLSILFPAELRGALMDMIRKSSGKKWESVNIPILDARTGDSRTVLWNSACIFDKGGTTVQATIAQGVDVTMRLRAEDKLHQSEEKYRSLFNSVSDAIFIYDQSTLEILEANEATSKLYGYAPSELIGMSCLAFSAEVDESRKVATQIELSGRASVPFRHHKKKDGSDLYVQLNGYKVVLGKDVMMFTVCRDITGKIESDEKIKALSKFPDENDNPVLRLSKDGRILYSNQASALLVKAWGCESGQPVAEEWTRVIKTALETGKAQSVDIDIAGRIFELLFKPIPEPGYVNIYGLDVTEKKAAERLAGNLLAEKKLLLKEVHHRLKNNMTMIQSLLKLQSETQDDPDVARVLDDAAGRVKSMLILYEKLYTSENYTKVSIREYVRSLITEIGNILPRHIQISAEVPEVVLDAKIVSSLGIIINELITNSIKYAFSGTAGSIIIAATVEGNLFHLEYGDSGIGLPESIGFETSTGFGMMLVKILVDQIHGSIRIERSTGTKFVLEFGM